ncbi:hypothetical protein [Neotamlana nanhaiensis]|nr:hypothetical protein [Tamlana nanhaiensis]
MNSSLAQSSQTDLISQSKIKALGFMVGNWKGNGWMMRGPNKSEFNQIENIQFKLDSTAILIEGLGKVKGRIIHNALAILSYNKETEAYSFRSYLPSGQNAEFQAELINEKLFWYPNKNMRYIIWINENEQWQETGEYNRDGTWIQFFEMTLNRVE